MTERNDRIDDPQRRHFPPYPKYRDSGAEWLGAIPAHWGVGRLKDHGALVGGAGFPHDYQGNDDEVLPFYKVGDLSASSDGRYMGKAPHTVSFEVAAELRAHVIPVHSIIYAKIGAALLLNRSRITTRPCCIDNNMSAYVLHPRELASKWAFYWTTIVDFAALANPGAVLSLSEGDQAVIPIVIPPMTEQRAIADFLDQEEEREVDVSRIYPTTHFGFRKITVERPLRLDFQASPEWTARLDDQRAFVNLARSRKKGPAKAKDEAAGREKQAVIRALLRSLPDRLYLDGVAFEAEICRAAQTIGLKFTAPIKKAVLSALSERNTEAEICRDRKGRPEPDPQLRDTENVPLLGNVESFFEREIKPHVPDAWIDTKRRDPQDGKVGLVGYEINFNRYFYEYRPPRPLEEIEADIQQVESEILAMLQDMTGS